MFSDFQLDDCQSNNARKHNFKNILCYLWLEGRCRLRKIL